MEKNSIWLPLVASVGIGAATFYSMTNQQQNVGQALQQAAPFSALNKNQVQETRRRKH